MQIHEIDLIVKEDDLDDLNHVNNVRYVQWVQDAAEAHWNLKATETIRNEFYWVMISHHIQYKAEALLGDQLLIKTYVTESKGVRSTRMVDIYNKATEQLLTSSTTIWCFMSMETHKPTRIPEEINQLFD
ncbi:thioesterase family protein [Psychroserpens sp.]|uniref:acyl-CoA thioesterase n=1 Tax=Psychroserpens sp. TaxID=2020870 RepID=UPI001B14C581|nr:thioesterase family protein [Psychroserpens sp.]MBO6606758.1 acyl-CoA thioesterase [Psychroserpens sp.]MBO6632471.1 acyl-CoA thioesterase [Psychroserpens sp.]MBO6653461.1 acyl-CoA thioesterase [Psychroserpens sp.]MBO6680511.1 acyl-CoA thioesterase [Psychroserpens sp.]MBO6750530.1 acyl-CoA thioesterase [Psychroserpens sp.]